MRTASEQDPAEEKQKQKEKSLPPGAQWDRAPPPPLTAKDPFTASASAFSSASTSSSSSASLAPAPTPAPALVPNPLFLGPATSVPSGVVTAPAPPLRWVSHSGSPAIAAASGSSTPKMTTTTTTTMAGGAAPEGGSGGGGGGGGSLSAATPAPAPATGVAVPVAATRHWAPWTREEDRRILELREERVKVATIAEMMQRTLGAVTGRLQILRKKEKERRRTSLGLGGGGGGGGSGGDGEFVFVSLSLFLFWELCERSLSRGTRADERTMICISSSLRSSLRLPPAPPPAAPGRGQLLRPPDLRPLRPRVQLLQPLLLQQAPPPPPPLPSLVLRRRRRRRHRS